MSNLTSLKKILCLTAVLFLSACATDSVNVTDDYIKDIDLYSDGDVQYEGAYNNFKYRATIQNTAIQITTNEKKAEIYLWDAIKKQQELTLAQAENGSKTKVF